MFSRSFLSGDKTYQVPFVHCVTYIKYTYTHTSVNTYTRRHTQRACTCVEMIDEIPFSASRGSILEGRNLFSTFHDFWQRVVGEEQVSFGVWLCKCKLILQLPGSGFAECDLIVSCLFC